jgi:hypothetical protein
MSEQPLLISPCIVHERAVPLSKVAAVYFERLVLLDPVGANWDTAPLAQCRHSVRRCHDGQ